MGYTLLGIAVMTTGDPENYFKAHLKYVLEYEDYGSKIAGWLQELT